MRQLGGELWRWGWKAVGGLLANLALLVVWVDGVGLHPAVAIVPNFVLLSAAGYVLTNRWIFPDGVSPTTARGHLRQYAGMQAAMLGSKAVNYVLYLALLSVTHYLMAWVIGAVATFLLSFGLNRWWWDDGGLPVS